MSHRIPHTPDAIYRILMECNGMAGLLHQYALDNGGNAPFSGHLLSGLSLLQHRLEDLQEILDPCRGLLALRTEVNHARN